MTAVARVDGADIGDRLMNFAIELLPRFTVVDVSDRDPIVLILLNRYRRSMGLAPGPVTGDGWRGLAFDGKLVLVYSERRVGSTIVVAECCPANNRYGKLACYALMLFYRTMYENGQTTGIAICVLSKNHAMQRALVRVFGDIAEIDEHGNPVPHAVILKLGTV